MHPQTSEARRRFTREAVILADNDVREIDAVIRAVIRADRAMDATFREDPSLYRTMLDLEKEFELILSEEGVWFSTKSPYAGYTEYGFLSKDDQDGMRQVILQFPEGYGHLPKQGYSDESGVAHLLAKRRSNDI